MKLTRDGAAALFRALVYFGLRMTTESEIRARIEESRKELLDLSLRNRLLNWRPLTARGVEIVGESATQVFATLVMGKRPMTFLPAVEDETGGSYTLWGDESEQVFFANQTDNKLQTAETPAALQRRLLNTFRLANTAVEETGVNTLFLGLGMLRWFESDSSQEERWAPLVLVPVSLERTGVRSRFRLLYTGEDLGVNLSLQEKAREEFNLRLPGQDALEPEDGGEADIARYVAQLKEAVRRSAPERWSVEEDRIVLGFFSFNKLLMYLDLGDPSVVNNEIITALFNDQGFSEPESAIGERERTDDRLSSSDVFHVLDADSSQALAIHDAAHGRNMVIQGPPGTGKSQTIANVIAESVAQGKRVLFVSEKMAALDVVKRRLDNIGLGVACLELHSHKTNKRETLQELGRILNLTSQEGDGFDADIFDQVDRLRRQLNDYADAVNVQVGKSGVPPYTAFGRLLDLNYDKTANPIDRREFPDIGEWTGNDFQRKKDVVEDLRLRLKGSGVPNQHPFWGSRLRIVLPDTRTELQDNIENALKHLTQLTIACKALADATGLECPEMVSTAHDLLMASQQAVGAPDTTGLDLKDPAWGHHPAKILGLTRLGRQWQSVRGARIDSLAHALQDLTDASNRLADAMRLDRPTSVAQAAELLAAAKCVIGAPNTAGVDLSAAEWESRGERIQHVLTLGLRWKQIRADNESVLLPQAWNTDFQHARLAINIDGRSFFKRLFSSEYKRARLQLAAAMRGELPRGIDQQLSLIDAISEEQSIRAEIEEHHGALSRVVGHHWKGIDTDWEAIEPACRWWLAVLADVGNGRVPAGATQLLRKLAIKLDAESVRPLIEALDSALVRHDGRLQDLKELLDADYGRELPNSSDVRDLPFDGQRRLMRQLLERCPRGDDGSAGQHAQATLGLRMTPGELAKDINRIHGEVGSVLGKHWNHLDTDWVSISPAVRWWLDVLAESQAGWVTVGTLDRLQVLTQRTEDGNGDRDWHCQSEALRNALEGYPRAVMDLQSALELDNELRFRNPEGLTQLPFGKQRQVLRDWESNLARIQDLAAFNAGADAASQEGLSRVVSVAAENPAATTSLTRWFERVWYEGIVEAALLERPSLRNFDGNAHEARIERFKSIDDQSLSHNKNRVAMAHQKSASRPKQLPPRLVRANSETEADDTRERQLQLRILQREIQKRTRHKPIRRLLNEAGLIVQDLKPVFMMSPLSIANYLEPDSVAFDLVVFDEASQVRPVDALGAMLRAEKAVVVGDSRQLPPSSFFDRMVQSNDDEIDDESVTADIESILGLFASKGAPSRNLRWHYRSRHESLIAVSNQEFYDNSLVVFPSPDAGREATGLRYHHLPDAVYDRGRSAINRQEAEAVARAVMEHAERHSDLSLGVAAFSQSQARAIEDQLEILRFQDDSGEGFFAAHPEEPFFVKNLENVQGDERDVIFISIGYGRDSTGQVSMNFGPLNNQGGERRLNVLITRAKHQCHVFSNLKAADIDTIRTRSAGVQALKTFLEYAETGDMPKDDPHPSNFSVDSPFQREVARRLMSLGYEVHEEVASGGKFVDIGIVDPNHPGRYAMGIECDGAPYHSYRSARDRDRLREQVLEGLGWTLHRIWSTDWFKSPERELKRAVDAIEHALRSSRK